MEVEFAQLLFEALLVGFTGWGAVRGRRRRGRLGQIEFEEILLAGEVEGPGFGLRTGALGQKIGEVLGAEGLEARASSRARTVRSRPY
jgi:hypothetical protein